MIVGCSGGNDPQNNYKTITAFESRVAGFAARGLFVSLGGGRLDNYFIMIPGDYYSYG